ncbi:transglycosylase SLT domain-containing protein [Bosea sp. (in: a-proteobacteria)]|uniref:transglycosylase SLT domain-containing protein n=1 Tax=Bosea sp. (in: a-proteobacteria) TaxID=1871050 RepID=UPI003B3B2D59
MAAALKKGGEVMGVIGEKLDKAATEDAYAAGLEKVGRDAEGNPTVERPAFAITHSDRAFEAGARAGLLSKYREDAQRGMLDIANQHQADPAAFDAASKDYVRNFASSADPSVKPLARAEAEKFRQQHYLTIQNGAVKRQTGMAKDAILVQIESTSNDIYALARQGGTETPEFKDAATRLEGLYDSLRNNPLFEVGKERAASEMRTTIDRARGFEAAGKAASIYDSQGEKAAQKWLIDNIRDNPELKISDSQRSGLVEIGSNAIAMRKGENKAKVDANRASATVLAKAMEDGKPLPQGAVDQAIETATKLGDVETAAKLLTSKQVYGRNEATRGLSDEERVRQATSAAVAPADVSGVITAAADRYGISRNYALRVAHIESRFDPNAINGGSKATGLFQFIPSTWKSYGAGQSALDPSANADAAMRLTVANRDQLRRSLGREPTEGELYLAHQQGAGGAAKLLAAPNVRAVDVVGERAVLGNGGTLDMTAGQFAQKWIRKVDGAGGVSMPAAPYTQQQMAANPYLAPTWLKSQLAGNRELIDSAKAVISAASSAIDKGNLPDAQTLAGAIQIADQNPHKLGRERDEILAKVRGVDEGEQANSAGGAAGALLVQDVMRRAQGQPIFVQMQAEATKATVERGVKNLKEQPWNEAVRRGWAQAEPPPLDLSNQGNLNAGIAMRGQIAGSIAARSGLPGFSALSPADVAQVSTVWNYGTADQKSSVLSALAQLPDQMLEPTLRSLGEDKQSGELAFVAGLHRESPVAAMAVIRGQQALLANPKFAPKPEEWRTDAMEKSLPLSIAAPERSGIRQYIGAAAKSVYAGLSARDGDESGVLNQSRLDEATAIVTGGLVEHNGGKLIPPTRGMTQDQFDKVLWSLTDADFAGASSKSGIRVTAQDVRRNFVLRGIADGRYALQARNSPAEWLYQPAVLGRDIDNTAGGYQGEQRFILDLKGRQPGADARPAEIRSVFGLGFVPNMRR